MTELKTLKDLDFSEAHIDAGYGDGCGFFPENINKILKAEAVKIIKYLNEEDDYNKHDYMDTIYCNLGISWEECSDIPAVISFIKHFFNLTEEDLNYNIVKKGVKEHE